jgi:hypothetical protein
MIQLKQFFKNLKFLSKTDLEKSTTVSGYSISEVLRSSKASSIKRLSSSE